MKYFIVAQDIYNNTSGITIANGNNFALSLTAYSGDVIRDESVNLTDIAKVYNDAAIFSNGYSISDVTGDNTVNLADIVITYNNTVWFVTRIRP